MRPSIQTKTKAIKKLLAQVDAYEGQLQSAMAQFHRGKGIFESEAGGVGDSAFRYKRRCSSDLTNGKDPDSAGHSNFHLWCAESGGVESYGALGGHKAGRCMRQYSPRVL